MNPYRTSARPLQEKVRCCGLCDQAVGGCLHKIVFKVSAWNLRGSDDLPAGVSRRAPQGTPPLVSADSGETWQQESEE
jgi:hypothetical protein